MANRFKGINAQKRLKETKVESTIKTEEQKPRDASNSTSGKVGRPKGKRSGGDYQQVTVYLSKARILEIKDLLYQIDRENLIYSDSPFEKLDFSDVVEEALLDWHTKTYYKFQDFNEEKRKKFNQEQFERNKELHEQLKLKNAK